MRDKKGFLDINDYIDMHKELDSHKAYWLSNDKTDFVFINLKGIRLYRELIYPIILKNIKVDAVKNDLATYKHSYGIYSKSYCSINCKVYSFMLLIQKYCEDVLKCHFDYKQETKMHNISDMLNILKWFCKANNIEFQEGNAMNELFLSFIMQILLANDDNNMKNKEIYFEKTLKFSPFYDFDFYGWVNLKIPINISIKNYRFGFYTDRSVEKPNTYIETIEHFKHYATKEEMEIFMTYLELLQMLRIDDQYEEIEAKIHSHIPESTKLELKKNYETNLRNVDALINDKK